MNGRSDCKYSGHCWHEAGGVPYQRHAGRDPGLVAVTCCWCADTREMPMHGKAKLGTIDPSVDHGSHSGRPNDE